MWGLGGGPACLEIPSYVQVWKSKREGGVPKCIVGVDRGSPRAPYPGGSPGALCRELAEGEVKGSAAPPVCLEKLQPHPPLPMSPHPHPMQALGRKGGGAWHGSKARCMEVGGGLSAGGFGPGSLCARSLGVREGGRHAPFPGQTLLHSPGGGGGGQRAPGGF